MARFHLSMSIFQWLFHCFQFDFRSQKPKLKIVPITCGHNCYSEQKKLWQKRRCFCQDTELLAVAWSLREWTCLVFVSVRYLSFISSVTVTHFVSPSAASPSGFMSSDWPLSHGRPAWVATAVWDSVYGMPCVSVSVSRCHECLRESAEIVMTEEEMYVL